MANKLINEPRRDYITLKDPVIESGIDNFYKVCQLHRIQYRDPTELHPLSYLERKDFYYQCPSDMTSLYLKYPTYYIQYKHPLVLPLTLERTNRFPLLPDRSLQGRYQ